MSSIWHIVVVLLFVVLFLPLNAAILNYLERKLMAWMQDRLGPYHLGPQGIFQLLADIPKMLLKEDIIPRGGDRIVFLLAPMIFFAPVVAAFALLPVSPWLTGVSVGTGILFYVALSSLDVIGVFMAGWGSNNKYGVIGGLRSAAQMISYELPLVLSLVSAVMLTSTVAGCVGTRCGIGSIGFGDIVAAQLRTPWLWFVLVQPLSLLLYYICGLAETNRSPFDLPEAESELVAGYLTEYSGLRWAMFFLGEYGNMAVVSGVATTLFLGGWSGPGAAIGFWTGLLGSFWGQVIFNGIAAFWFFLKMFVLGAVFIWIRATLPRLRADQLMQFAWLFLIPLTLLNILVTAAVLLLPLDVSLRLLLAGVSNWGLLVLIVLNFRRLIGLRPVTSAGAPAPHRLLARTTSLHDA